MLLVLFAGIALSWTGLLTGKPGTQSSLNVNVTISPPKVTLYAGETQSFVATISGADDKSVNWAVDEEEGGSISVSGLYTAPKLQGVYHVTVTSRSHPEKKAVATITVLTYCDPLPTVRRW